MRSSSAAATGTTYRVRWTAATSTAIAGIVVDFCSNSPLIGQSCTAASGATVPDIGASPTVTSNGGITGTWNATTNGAAPRHTLMLARSAGTDAMTAGTTIVDFNITGVTNPTGAVGSFYARILTYAAGSGATSYVPGTEGTYIDSGGVALSTANQLTVSARVQEQLQFCVGGTTVNDATTSLSTSCAAAFAGSGTCGNTVDLGVVDGGSVYVSPLSAATNGGNGCNGAAMVRTNAANGVTISYYPEAGTGTNHTRALRVTGATCDATDPSTDNTDKCFNSRGQTQGTITAGTESFGMTVAAVNPASTTAYSCTFLAGTCKVTRNASYDGNGTTTFTTDTGAVAGTSNQSYAWYETGTAQPIASSTGVVDDEALILKFAATSSITTPTGTYGATSTYIATASF